MIYTKDQKPPISALERSKQINFLESGYNPVTGMINAQVCHSSVVIAENTSYLTERSLFKLTA